MERQAGLKELSEYQEQWQFHREGNYWSLEGIPYCKNVRVPELQCMNLYVPGAYRNEDGTWNRERACGGYTAGTAPIIFENGIGGYAESRPLKLALSKEGRSEFMDAGMVFISPGARGKQTKGADGQLIGKSPAGLVDLKSAVRYLRHCSGQIPGDTEKIVSVGVSAGGAMSSLLGATGNSRKYNPWLAENGAYMDERDDIYGAQCYCPIIDLEHADMAYEWMFQGITEFEGTPSAGSGALNEFQRALSEKLAARYVSYFNSLGLHDPKTGRTFFLSEDGNGGTAMNYLLNVLDHAASKYMKKLADGSLGYDYSVEEYLDGRYTYKKRRPSGEKGGDPVYEELAGCEKRSWLSWDGKAARVKSLREMEKEYLKRLKPCTSFDSLECTQAENQEFGDETHDFVHFDQAVSEILEELRERYPKEYEMYGNGFWGLSDDKALNQRIDLLNPFNFIGTREVVSTAPHYRIRVGTRDGHTSFTMSMTLALKLINAQASDVDYAMVWEAGHEKADYAGEFVEWVKKITGESFMELRDVPHGALSREIYYAKNLRCHKRLMVYTPPGYHKSGEAYPVLYLQHGGGENETGWEQFGHISAILDNLLAEGKCRPFLVVMCDGGVTYDTQAKYRGELDLAFSDMLLDSCIPYIETNYRVKTGKWNRALAGLSLGAYQTACIGLAHPELFGSLGIFSGGFTENLWDCKNPASDNLKIPGWLAREYRVFFRSIGTADEISGPRFHRDTAVLKELGLSSLPTVFLKEYPGLVHEWSAWQRSLRDFAPLIFNWE